MPPPVFPLIAAPFYLAAGWAGVFWLSALSFVVVVLTVRSIAYKALRRARRRRRRAHPRVVRLRLALLAIGMAPYGGARPDCARLSRRARGRWRRLASLDLRGDRGRPRGGRQWGASRRLPGPANRHRAADRPLSGSPAPHRAAVRRRRTGADSARRAEPPKVRPLLTLLLRRRRIRRHRRSLLPAADRHAPRRPAWPSSVPSTFIAAAPASELC